MTDDSGDRTDSQTMQVARGSPNTHRPGLIPARILWPALGFPAVIDPRSPSKFDDASSCVTVLILSKRSRITSKEVAEHLRFVPWEQRHTRYLPSGTDHGFTEDEIEVRSDEDKQDIRPRPGLLAGFADEFAHALHFGYDLRSKAPGANAFWAGLSKFVLKKYYEWKYYYLYEIHISRAASSRLAADKYNLFWINANWNDTESDRSDEMNLLLKQFATPRRKPLVDSLSEDAAELNKIEGFNRPELLQDFLFKEYEYDYHALHEPYTSKPYSAGQKIDPMYRTEVLHPLFVRQSTPKLQIGHITDLHVDVRSDVYEDNLQREGIKVDFNNWNKSVINLYNKAKGPCDVLLLTGDLIDYGRGHLGIPAGDVLGDDAMYHVDRNWFLFYYVLASGNSYEKPVYTILGNHDWRINPYPPFAIAGAPSPKSLINDYSRFKPKELEEIIRKAHGDGYDKKFSYLSPATGIAELAGLEPGLAFKEVKELLKQTQTMDVPGFPTETSEESIAWYLLLINPFLDYAFQLPGGYDVLMLDWAQKEDVLFPIVGEGEEHLYLPWQSGDAATPGPKAANCLTYLQKRFVEDFVKKPGSAKVLGIHAPPIGPYPGWTDDWIYAGRIELPPPRTGYPGDDRLPGSVHYRTKYPDGTRRNWYGHPFYAVQPEDGLAGQTADYGSLQKDREWLIKELRKDDAHIRLVLSGHIHRDGLFVVHVGQGDPENSVVAGQMLTRRVVPQAALGARPPAVTRTHEGERGPLFVNTTSAGPRGHVYQAHATKYEENIEQYYVDSGYAVIDLASDGTIQKVAFGTTKIDAAPVTVAPAAAGP
jgi:3',5'-cyclic AMP phosphodiesterase CpdA